MPKSTTNDARDAMQLEQDSDDVIELVEEIESTGLVLTSEDLFEEDVISMDDGDSTPNSNPEVTSIPLADIIVLQRGNSGQNDSGIEHSVDHANNSPHKAKTELPRELQQTQKIAPEELENVELSLHDNEMKHGALTKEPPPIKPPAIMNQKNAVASNKVNAVKDKPAAVSPPPLNNSGAPSNTGGSNNAKTPNIAAQPSKAPVGQDIPEIDLELEVFVEELLEEERHKTERVQNSLNKEVTTDNWFEHYFNTDYLRTLPNDWRIHTKKDADFMEQSLAVEKSGRILDLACGTGRHTIELTQRGLHVVGLDLSVDMLEYAADQARDRALAIQFVQGDMRELSFQAIFDGCILWHTSFGFFDDETNYSVLQNIARCLKPGGRLLLDVVNRDYILGDMPARLWWEGNECIFLEESEFDYFNSVLHTKRTLIFENGMPPQEKHSYIRLYSAHELKELFESVGFELIEVSGERCHRGYMLGAASKRLIILAQKS